MTYKICTTSNTDDWLTIQVKIKQAYIAKPQLYIILLQMLRQKVVGLYATATSGS